MLLNNGLGQVYDPMNPEDNDLLDYIGKKSSIEKALDKYKPILEDNYSLGGVNATANIGGVPTIKPPTLNASINGNNLGISVNNNTYGTYNQLTKKNGTKATRNNNPGDITGMSGKLLYGAIGFAHSKTGDTGDHTQLIYKTPLDGFRAMHKLAVERYSNAPIKIAFSRWQKDKKSFKQKLYSLSKAGIDINKKYTDLTRQQQIKFRDVWSRYEGYKGPKEITLLNGDRTISQLNKPGKLKLDNKIVNEAAKELNKPYKWGAKVSDNTGDDCSSLTCKVVQKAKGIKIPRTAQAQWKSRIGKRIQSPKKGDAIYFNFPNKRGVSVSHTGICADDDCSTMIEASHSAGKVRVKRLTEAYKKHIVGFKRY